MFSFAPSCNEEPLTVTSTPVVADWSAVAELSLTTAVELALGADDGVAVGEGVGVGVGVSVGAAVGTGVGVGVEAGFTVTETALEAGDVTGVEALSVTLQVTECEPAAAV